MSKICQEKFQVSVPENRNEDVEGWVSDKSARVKKGTPGREGRAGGDPSSRSMNNARLYTSLPPGMDITDAELSDIRKQRMVTAGTDDVSDNPSGENFRTGYVPVTMRPTDDMYTNEHQDCFYDEIKVDGVTGYLERNNYLDRN